MKTKHEISNYAKMHTFNKVMKIVGSSGIYKKTRYHLEVWKNNNKILKILKPLFEKNLEARWNFGILIRKAILLLI